MMHSGDARAASIGRALGTLGAAAVGSALLLALLLTVSGYDAADGLQALWRGAFGSWSAMASGTLVRAAPLLFTGLAVSLAFSAGVLNIGAEGQLLVGAIAATAVGLTVSPSLGLLGAGLALLAGAGAGGAWASVPAMLRQRFGVLEVISTIMLNFVALYLAGLVVRGPLQEPTRVYPQSASIPDALQLPTIMPGTRLHAGVMLGVVLALLMAWVLRQTAAGFRLRATGANAAAAASAGGVAVARVILRAFVLSGALAGLGGAVEVLGVTYALYENLSPGYGYTAIAVALLARLQPVTAIGSAVLFGALEAGAAAMQRDAGIPAVLVSVVEACVILMIVAVEWLRARSTGVVSLNRGAPPDSPVHSVRENATADRTTA
jgi:general nucleoside transport system permease protein